MTTKALVAVPYVLPFDGTLHTYPEGCTLRVLGYKQSRRTLDTSFVPVCTPHTYYTYRDESQQIPTFAKS
jgi:hypothetical protein